MRTPEMRWMSFPLAVLAATAGNVVGSLLAYGLGASRLLQRLPGARAVLRRWESLLDRHGTRAVFIARLLQLARTFVSLPAGARHVRLAPFIALTAIGCALWAAAFVTMGLVVRQRLGDPKRHARQSATHSRARHGRVIGDAKPARHLIRQRMVIDSTSLTSRRRSPSRRDDTPGRLLDGCRRVGRRVPGGRVKRSAHERPARQ